MDDSLTWQQLWISSLCTDQQNLSAVLVSVLGLSGRDNQSGGGKGLKVEKHQIYGSLGPMVFSDVSQTGSPLYQHSEDGDVQRGGTHAGTVHVMGDFGARIPSVLWRGTISKSELLACMFGSFIRRTRQCFHDYAAALVYVDSVTGRAKDTMWNLVTTEGWCGIL